MAQLARNDSGADTLANPIDRAIAAAPAALRGKVRIPTSDVRQALNCTSNTIWGLRQSGRLSDPVYTGQRQAMWLASEVLEILAGDR